MSLDKDKIQSLDLVAEFLHLNPSSILENTIGASLEDKQAVFEILGKHQNLGEIISKLLLILDQLKSGVDADQLDTDLSPKERALAQVLLVSTGIDQSLSKLYDAEAIFSLSKKLNGSSVDEIAQTFIAEIKLIESLKSIITNDGKGQQRLIQQRLAVFLNQSNNGFNFREEPLVSLGEKLSTVYGLHQFKDLGPILWESARNGGNIPWEAVWIKLNDVVYLVAKAQGDEQLLRSWRDELRELRGHDQQLDIINSQLLQNQLNQHQPDTETFSTAMQQRDPKLAAEVMIRGWEKLTHEVQQQVKKVLIEHHETDRALDLALEQLDKIPETLLETLGEMHSWDRINLALEAFKIGKLDQLIPYIQEFTKIEDQNKVAFNFYEFLKISIEQQIPLPQEVISIAISTKQNQFSAISLVINDGGLELYFKIPPSVIEQFSFDKINSDLSKFLGESLIKNGQLGECPVELLEKMTLTRSLVISWLIKDPQLKFPPVLQTKVSQLKFSGSDYVSLVGFAAEKNDMSVLDRAGGNGFKEVCLSFFDSDTQNADKLLGRIVEQGWISTPSEVKDVLLNIKWRWFSELFLELNDSQAVAQIIGRSGLLLKDVDKNISQDEKFQQYRVFFAGCTQQDIDNTLDESLFRSQFFDFYELITEKGQLDEYQAKYSLGEQALIIRCASRGFNLEKTKQLLDIARESPLTRFGTISLLTQLHRDNIYWENFGFKSREDVLWNSKMRDQYFMDEFEGFKVEELIIFILGNGSAHDNESVFFVLDLATKEPEKILKEGETLRQKHFQELCEGFIHRLDPDPRIVQRLANLAGWTEPENFIKLLEEDIARWPSPNSIHNIITLSRNAIDNKTFKRVAMGYLSATNRLSGEAFKVIFDYLRDDPEHAFTDKEKRQCWTAYHNMFIPGVRSDRAIAMSSIRLCEFQPFASEDILTLADYQEFIQEYLNLGGDNSQMFEFLLEKSITNERETQGVLQFFLTQDRYASLTLLKVFNSFNQQKNYTSPETTQLFELYLARQDINFHLVIEFLEEFSDRVSAKAVKKAVIDIAERKDNIDDRLLPLLANYSFTPADARQLVMIDKQTYKFSNEALDACLELANYSEIELTAIVWDYLRDTALPRDSWALELFLERLNYDQLHDIALEYFVDQSQIVRKHGFALRNTLIKKDEQKGTGFWAEVVAQKDEYSFFKETDYLEKRKATGELSKNGYIYDGDPAIKSENAVDLQEDSRVYYRNRLIYWENCVQISGQKVAEIIGSELIVEIEALKKQAIAIVLERGDNLWFLNREQALNQTVVMGHGTGQAFARKEGVARAEEETFGAQQIVQKIIEGPDGVGLRGEKATIGAFTNPGIDSHYGSAKDGMMVIFFTEDMLASHGALSDDPSRADGWVGRDSSTGRLIQIPNRVVLNPQGKEIQGFELTNSQMTEYIFQLKYELSKNLDLVQKIEEAALQYEQEQMDDNFLEEIKTIHLNFREQGYPEGGIIWARDYYITLAHSDEPESKRLFNCLRKTVLSVQEGANYDLRSVFDNIRLSWGLGLSEQYQPWESTERTIEQAQEIMINSQRKAFLSAMRGLRDKSGEPVGVLRQQLLQESSAVAHQDVPRLPLSRSLALNRAIFLDKRTQAEGQEILDEVEELADRSTRIKQSVLKSTFIRGIGELEEEDRLKYEEYKEKVAICVSGSVGRNEVVISSDLDYLVLVDDIDFKEKDHEILREILFKVGTKVNRILEDEYQIRPDAGLANRDRQPVVLLSELKNFKIELSQNRQKVEPTEILDATSISAEGIKIVSKFKATFINKDIELKATGVPSTSDYINRDIDGFEQYYNAGMSQVLARDQLVDFKMQLQRIFNFKVYGLLSQVFDRFSEDRVEIPSSTREKIILAEQYGVISAKQAGTLRELSLLFYRMRYRSDVINSAQLAQMEGRVSDSRAKVIAKFDPRSLTAFEASRMVDLLQQFDEI